MEEVLNWNMLCGKFNFKGGEYPFVLDGRILTVVRAKNEYLDGFDSIDTIDYLEGSTSNRKIVFLYCKRLGGAIAAIQENIRFSIQIYATYYGGEDSYDKLVFQSPALRAFFSPRKAFNFQSEKLYQISGISLNQWSDINQKFTCSIDGENIECILEFSSRANLKFEDNTPLSINPRWSMTFKSPKKSTDIGKYYLYVRDFLVFANFQNDIPMEDIVIYKLRPDGQYAESGKAVIFQRDYLNYKPSCKNTITFDDLDINILPRLFSLVAERRTTGNYNPYFFPNDSQDKLTIDPAKWLITAISFEGEFNNIFSSFKSEKDETFRAVKNQLLDTIEKAVMQSGYGINNKRNSSLRSFKNLISHYDVTIKDKFAFCETEFAPEMVCQMEQICIDSQLPPQSGFAEEYSTTRNCIAHGSIKQLEPVDFATYRILRCFIYLLIMSKAGVPLESRKNIIKKIF